MNFILMNDECNTLINCDVISTVDCGRVSSSTNNGKDYFYIQMSVAGNTVWLEYRTVDDARKDLTYLLNFISDNYKLIHRTEMNDFEIKLEEE